MQNEEKRIPMHMRAPDGDRHGGRLERSYTQSAPADGGYPANSHSQKLKNRIHAHSLDRDLAKKPRMALF